MPQFSGQRKKKTISVKFYTEVRQPEEIKSEEKKHLILCVGSIFTISPLCDERVKEACSGNGQQKEFRRDGPIVDEVPEEKREIGLRAVCSKFRSQNLHVIFFITTMRLASLFNILWLTKLREYKCTLTSSVDPCTKLATRRMLGESLMAERQLTDPRAKESPAIVSA